MQKNMIENYIQEQTLAWSPTTIKSERSRLRNVCNYLTDDPEYLWKNLGQYQSYTRATTWTRVCKFYDWLVEQGHKNSNPYPKWRIKNARLFKHAYERKYPVVSFTEAKRLIGTISDESIRQRCYELLTGGLR